MPLATTQSTNDLGLSPWTRFWSDQKTFEDDLLGHNVNVFLKSSADLMSYSAGDSVLDIGCGPGHLLEALAPRVDRVCGVDVSAKYVTQCGTLLARFPRVQVKQLTEDYTDLSILKGTTYNKIVCLSVIQYYRDKNEVQRLIRSVKKIAAPGARFLIADILIQTSLLEDTLSVLRSAMRERAVLQTVKFLFRAQFGQYAQLRRQSGLLSFTAEELQNMARGENLESELISRRLTVNDNRSHILIRM